MAQLKACDSSASAGGSIGAGNQVAFDLGSVFSSFGASLIHGAGGNSGGSKNGRGEVSGVVANIFGDGSCSDGNEAGGIASSGENFIGGGFSGGGGGSCGSGGGCIG